MTTRTAVIVWLAVMSAVPLATVRAETSKPPAPSTASEQALEAIAANPHGHEGGSYALGYRVGEQLIAEYPNLIHEAALLLGVRDAVSGPRALIADVDRSEALRQLLAKAQEMRLAAHSAEASDSRALGALFLERNATRAGVISMPSGLQIRVIESGDGPQPDANDLVRVHYHGTLIDGTVFDSSRQRGRAAAFAVNEVIQGWQEALPMMHVGDRWRIFVPPELGYGERGAGSLIGPWQTLIFDLELLEIE